MMHSNREDFKMSRKYCKPCPKRNSTDYACGLGIKPTINKPKGKERTNESPICVPDPFEPATKSLNT